ncbi:DUF1501 domain-containing protein [Opitutales bacterium]|nr:DUF1501 domain-containing protein [Opitutales bacterium]
MNHLFPEINECSRRSLLLHAAKTTLGLSILPSFSNGANLAKPDKQAPCERVIFLYMRGGMSQTDTFDPKEKNSIGGKSKPVKTQSPDLLLSDQLPKLALQANDLSVIRSLTTKTGAHSQARYVMHTGYRQRSGMTHPQLGSWAQMFLGKSHPVLPSSVLVASGNPGPGFLPPEYSPLPIGNASRGIKDLLPEIDKQQLDRRVKLAQKFSAAFSHYFPHDDVKSYNDFYDQTVKFISGDMAEPFDIQREPANLKNRYGNHPFGQGTLLARRLVERGVRYVQVTSSQNWDSMHSGTNSLDRLSNELDGTVSALMTDLRDRGMLDSTMIVVTTEFGRTPKVKSNGGRDHHPNGFSAMMAGGGIRGGIAVGETDDYGRDPFPEFEPKDIHATIATALGITGTKIRRLPGRPTFLGGKPKPIKEILA